RAWKAGVQAACVTGDTVYGGDTHLRRTLEAHGQPYVLAVASDQQLWVDLRQVRGGRDAAGWPATEWGRGTDGAGAKGAGWYDWAVELFGGVFERGWQLWLLVRRHREKKQERAYYLCRGPATTPRQELIRVAGARWRLEDCFEQAKGECGLDE